ncbi:MAG: LemA family protein [Haliea sp.]|uniref:LemA family protein n=1 Tax=Haliea sp. TaxID=1932666 RepID=UPI0032EF25E1
MPDYVLVSVPLLGAAVWGLLIYNRLVGLRNQLEAAWSDIDVQLKRRHDLVPILVTTVKAYARHEQETLARVMEQRANALAATGPRSQFQAEAGVLEGVASVMVVAEAYPELKAGENFLRLQRDFVAIEDHIQYARRFYNGAVKLNNILVEQFPALLVARMFGFRQAEFFDADCS